MCIKHHNDIVNLEFWYKWYGNQHHYTGGMHEWEIHNLYISFSEREFRSSLFFSQSNSAWKREYVLSLGHTYSLTCTFCLTMPNH